VGACGSGAREGEARGEGKDELRTRRISLMKQHRYN
jgi:hypothetical protein